MLQLINKKKIYFYLFSFLFISTIFNDNLMKNLKNYFNINEVKVEKTKKEIDDLIKSNTSFLLGKNIFFLSEKLLLERIDKFNFIENITIKKKYPSIINIKFKTTNLIAIIYLDQKKYFIGQNGNFILAKQISNEKKLPTVFGKLTPDDYISLQTKLLNQKIDTNQIIKYYFHKNKRWDLYFANGTVIQLPNKNISKALNLFKEFKLNNKIEIKTIVDLRIQNRLILRNEQKKTF